MAAHDYHEALPGYSEAQILHDGCAECEARAKRYDHGISSLDQRNFARAWKRTTDWNCSRFGCDDGQDISKAEAPMLNALWAVQLQLERRGIPIGEVPGER